MRFDLSLSGSRLKLEEFAKINHLGPKTDLSGLATATLNLSNPVDPTLREPILQGSGTIDVPNGRLFDLPMQEWWLDETNLGASVAPAFGAAYLSATVGGGPGASEPYLMSRGNPYGTHSFPRHEGAANRASGGDPRDAV